MNKRWGEDVKVAVGEDVVEDVEDQEKVAEHYDEQLKQLEKDEEEDNSL